MSKSHEPRMHSAEHLLNRTMVEMFACDRSFSAHINRKKSKCDYRFGHALTEEQARELELRVNAVIAAQLDVTEQFLPREEAARLFDLTRLPDTSADPLRIIHIGTYDACPCIGSHVTNTREIGAFRIISHSFEKDVLRIRFKLAAPA